MALTHHNPKELKVWQKAKDLAVQIYSITSTFPKEEQYGLINQIRRSSVSVASNIAEGAGRNSNKEFIHFLGIANGSCYELETQIIISAELNYMEKDSKEEILSMITEIQKMCFSLNRMLRERL